MTNLPAPVNDGDAANKKFVIDVVSESIAQSGITRSILTVTSNLTVGKDSDTDYVIFVGIGGSLTMPTAVGNTNKYTIKNITATEKTVLSTSGQTFDGGTLTLAQNESVTLYSDNANWQIT